MNSTLLKAVVMGEELPPNLSPKVLSLLATEVLLFKGFARDGFPKAHGDQLRFERRMRTAGLWGQEITGKVFRH